MGRHGVSLFGIGWEVLGMAVYVCCSNGADEVVLRIGGYMIDLCKL